MAEVRAQSAIKASGDVEVDGGLLRVSTMAPGVGKYEQAKWAKRATTGRATAGAAVVADISLLGGDDIEWVEAEGSLDVELCGTVEAEREERAVVDGDAAEVGGVGTECLHLHHRPLDEIAASLGVQHHCARDRLQQQKTSGC